MNRDSLNHVICFPVDVAQESYVTGTPLSINLLTWTSDWEPPREFGIYGRSVQAPYSELFFSLSRTKQPLQLSSFPRIVIQNWVNNPNTTREWRIQLLTSIRIWAVHAKLNVLNKVVVMDKIMIGIRKTSNRDVVHYINTHRVNKIPVK